MATPTGFTTRRRFIERLGKIAVGVTALSWGTSGRIGSFSQPAYAEETTGLTEKLLDESPFAYISPLLSNGEESTCHAEVWYAWIDGGIVVTVASDRWKATALEKGLGRARVWVGNHGRWKGWAGSRNEEFRSAPHFDARVTRLDGPKTIERLLAVYEQKYPAEIANWRVPMRSGAKDGSRVLLRYEAIDSL